MHGKRCVLARNFPNGGFDGRDFTHIVQTVQGEVRKRIHVSVDAELVHQLVPNRFDGTEIRVGKRGSDNGSHSPKQSVNL